MDKTNLIVSGCSFTKGHTLEAKGSWATYLSEMMGLKLHNRAQGGAGNSYISTSIIGYLTTNPELISNSIVVVAWSEITRMLGTFLHKNDYHEIITIRPQDFIHDGQKGDWKSRGIDSYHGYVMEHRDILSPLFSTWNYAVYETYVAMLNLKNFLELHKIPYLFFDAIADSKVVIDNDKIILKNTHVDIHLNEPIIRSSHMSCILNQEVIDKIFNDERWISFYGNSMAVHMLLDPLKYNKYTQGNGGHPNEYASNYYAKIILNEYERLYNK
jgi:hypothetical protein